MLKWDVLSVFRVSWRPTQVLRVCVFFFFLTGALKQIMFGRTIDDWESDTSSIHSEIDTDQRASLPDSYNSSTLITRNDYETTPRASNDYDHVTPNFRNENVSATSINDDSLTPKLTIEYDIRTPKDHDNSSPMFSSFDNMTSNIYDNGTGYVPDTLKKLQLDNDIQEKQELMSFINGMRDETYWDTTVGLLGPTHTPGRTFHPSSIAVSAYN